MGWRLTVGRDPLASCADVFRNVETVVAAEKRAVAGKPAKRDAHKFQARSPGTGAQEVRNQACPEAGQRFVIAAVISVRSADASVVENDAGADFLQGLVGRVIENMASGDGDVCGVRPFAFRNCTGAPMVEEAAQGCFGACKDRLAGDTVFDCRTINIHCIRKLYGLYYYE